MCSLEVKKPLLFTLLFFAIFIENAHSQVQCVEGINGSDALLRVSKFIEKGMEITTANERMADYKVYHSCSDKQMTPTKPSVEYNRCADGSVSYEQPDSTSFLGIDNWNGYCGETSAANTMFMHCRVYANPTEYVNRFTKDITPGTLAGSLTRGLNKMYNEWPKDCPKGEWRHHSGADSPEQYISFLERGLSREGGSFERRRQDGTKIRRSPVPIMIEVPNQNKALHWVTLVDIQGLDKDTNLADQNSCFATINHWGNQYDVPCYRLARWAKNTKKGGAGLAVGSYPRTYFYPEDS